MKTVRAQLAQGYAWWEHQLTNMEGAQEPVAASGISFHLWRLYQHFWLLSLLFPIVSLVISIGTSGRVARVDWLQLIPFVLLFRGLGLDMTGVARLSSAIRELHAAREELARLAVVEERLRMARDLHDLLGHSLSLITRKSELVGRLVEKGPTRAVQEIREVELAARQTLREVREAVAGYRQPVLESELDGAQQMLSAAGIECMIEHTAGMLPPATDAVLAWTVREGVTNVIRHSRARYCSIRLTRENGTVRAEVINDGDQRQEKNIVWRRAGSGLSGLSERVTALGGHMEALTIQVTELEAGSTPSTGKECFGLLGEIPPQTRTISRREERFLCGCRWQK